VTRYTLSLAGVPEPCQHLRLAPGRRYNLQRYAD